MRIVHVLLVSVVVGGAQSSHADSLARVVAAFQPGQPGQPGTAGGQAKSPPAPPAPADDLMAWAGQPKPTTLPELLLVLVRQSPALQNAKLDIEIAQARVEQTYARGDWHLQGNIGVSRTQGGFFGGQAIDQSLNGFSDIDLFRQIGTGGTVTLHEESSYNKTSFVDPTVDAMFGSEDWTHTVSLGFSQPLLRGRGHWYYAAGERQAKLSRDASVLARRLVAINSVQVLISAYWDLVLAERQVAITQSSLDLAKERLRITQIGADGGKIPRSEIPAVQQIIATREEDVLNGELAVLERSVELRRDSGMTIGKGDLGLRVDSELVPGADAADLGNLTERAFAASPELAQLAKQEAGATIQVEVTENGLLPQLDAAISIGPTGDDTTFTGAWKNLAKLSNSTVAGTLTFQHNFGSENVRGLAREQRTARAKIRVTAADVKLQLAQAMARAVAQIELAKRRVALSQRAIDLANENIKIESDRFNLGKSTNFDVLNRQEELRQAELRKAQAIIDWHKAETTVQALTGDLLPTYGVSVE